LTAAKQQMPANCVLIQTQLFAIGLVAIHLSIAGHVIFTQQTSKATSVSCWSAKADFSVCEYFLCASISMK